jgi:tRNA-specific adenosine deaminase 2
MDDDDVHVNYMQLALEVAKSADKLNEVPIGCIFLHMPSGRILASSHNLTNFTKNATRHAEMVAIDDILTQHSWDIFQECVLYVTVEPCIMCASALRELKIRKVYFGAWNDKFGGTGGVLNIHSDDWVNAHGLKIDAIEAVGGLLRKEAILLLRQFYLKENTKAPKPQKKANRVLKHDIPPPPFVKR